jgi:ABC-type branched-subunit amino acid transport system substrate-binding protein
MRTIQRLSRKSPVALGLVLVLCCRGAEPVQAPDIVLGMSAAFSGPSKGLGIELYRGSMAYFEHVNSKGGVHGHKIVIKPYDDGYNPKLAIDNTTRLIDTGRGCQHQ